MDWRDKFSNGFYFVWGAYVGLLTIAITATLTIAVTLVLFAGILSFLGM